MKKREGDRSYQKKGFGLVIQTHNTNIHPIEKKKGENMWSVDIRDPDIGGPILFQLYKIYMASYKTDLM